MFLSYDHLQVEIYTSEMNMTGQLMLMYIYSHLKMVVRPKHVADNLNKIENSYWNRVALDESPWTWFGESAGLNHSSGWYWWNRTQSTLARVFIRYWFSVLIEIVIHSSKDTEKMHWRHWSIIMQLHKAWERGYGYHPKILNNTSYILLTVEAAVYTDRSTDSVACYIYYVCNIKENRDRNRHKVSPPKFKSSTTDPLDVKHFKTCSSPLTNRLPPWL
jgi:hypothetical protein